MVKKRWVDKRHTKPVKFICPICGMPVYEFIFDDAQGQVGGWVHIPNPQNYKHASKESIWFKHEPKKGEVDAWDVDGNTLNSLLAFEKDDNIVFDGNAPIKIKIVVI